MGEPPGLGALPGPLAVVAAPLAHGAGAGALDEVIAVGLLAVILGGLLTWDRLRRRKQREADKGREGRTEDQR